MAKKVFYRKKKGLPEWTQLYFVWAIALAALSPFAYFCGTQKIEKVEALPLPQTNEVQPVDFKTLKANLLLQNTSDYKTLINSLIINQKLFKIKAQKIDLHNFFQSEEQCQLIRLSHEQRSQAVQTVINFEVKDAFWFNRALIDAWLKNPQARSQLILASSLQCYRQNVLKETFDAKTSHNVIFVEHNTVYQKNAVYYGRNFSLPNIYYAATLRKIQPFSIWEHIITNFIGYETFPHAELLEHKINAFTLNAAYFFKNVTPDLAADFLEKFHLIHEKTLKEKQPSFKIWLTLQRQLGDSGMKFFYVLLIILMLFPLVIRLNQRPKINLVPAVLSTFMFAFFMALYFLLINLLSKVSANLLIYIVFSIFTAMAVFFTAKFFERKFLLLVIDTASAYIMVLAIMLWLFFADVQLFLFLLPSAMIFAQVKDSPAHLTLMALLVAIGFPMTVVIIALNYLFGFQTDAQAFFNLIDFNLHRFILFALLGGAMLTLASKNTRPKKYF